MILDLSVVSNASRTLKDGGGTAIGLGQNVNIHCSVAKTLYFS